MAPLIPVDWEILLMSFTRFNFGEYDSGTYSPSNQVIFDVTNNFPALVTTIEDHDYVIGNQISFLIPPQWGIRQLNGLKGYVVSIPELNQFEINIDTRLFDSFFTPIVPEFVVIDQPQALGIGDENFGPLSPGGVPVLPTTIQGAYINQKP